MKMNSFVFFIAVISVVFACVSAGEVPFTTCGTPVAKIISLDISNCTESHCPLKKGENSTVTMVFISNRNATEITNYAFGLIGPVRTPYPLDDYDACHSMTCPLKTGTAATYTSKVFVPEYYPTMTLPIEWQLRDTKEGTLLTCFVMNCNIED